MAARSTSRSAQADLVFRALADPSRRQLLDRLNAESGQTLRELCSGLEMSRQSVSKHLAILEDANLIATVWLGREKLHYLNASPIAEIANRWISRYHKQRVRALVDLKQALEAPTMDKPEFVYTTYIRTTPELLWRALTEPTFTRRYWGCSFDTDWSAGSTYVMEQGGVRITDTEQRVLESDPPRRLSYTWHTYSPEWGEAVGCRVGFSKADVEQLAAEPRSKVTFELEAVGDVVKLTVVHEGFAPESAALPSISQGWPQILSELKTLLEGAELASLSQ